MEPIDIANPLLSHYNFIKYTLTTRYGSNDEAFKMTLNEYDFPPAVIFFHGVHALYRMVRMISEPNLKFKEIEMPRKEDLPITEELLELYKNTIDDFINELKKMNEIILDEEIASPLNQKPIQRKMWFAQTIMHTIHHIGQAIRIQGIIDRKLTDHPVDLKASPNYRVLF